MKYFKHPIPFSKLQLNFFSNEINFKNFLPKSENILPGIYNFKTDKYNSMAKYDPKC